MRLPQWLTLLVAAWVIVFGLYRIKLAMDPKQALKKAEGKKGLFALGRRTHALLGVIYLLLGGALVATSFGWNPMAGVLAPSTDAPKAGSASGAGAGSAKPAPPKAMNVDTK